MKLKVLTLACALLGYGAQTADAASVSYSDRVQFEAALASSTTIDFEGGWPATWNAFNTASGYTTDGVNFVGEFGSSSHYLYVNNGTYGANFGGLTGDTLLFEGRGVLQVTLPNATNAVGFDFALTELVGATKEVNFTLASGESFTWSVTTGPTPNFFGVVSDSAITGFSFQSVLNERPPLVSVDNLTFGNALPPTPVPVPASLPLLVFGLCGLGLMARRKRSIS